MISHACYSFQKIGRFFNQVYHFPALPCEGSYDEGTIIGYRQRFDYNPPHNPKDRQWLQCRADILTDFLARLYREVKLVNPNLLVAIAPNIYDWAFQEYLQESPT